MADVSREDDLRDLRERMANGGNRLRSPVKSETLEQAIERTELEVKAGLAQIRAAVQPGG